MMKVILLTNETLEVQNDPLGVAAAVSGLLNSTCRI